LKLNTSRDTPTTKEEKKEQRKEKKRAHAPDVPNQTDQILIKMLDPQVIKIEA
jgi:hypothetical protein